MAIMSKNTKDIGHQSFDNNNSNHVSNSGAYSSALAKVPAVTLIFWLIKIASTTLGKTAGDALSMSLKLGYIVSTGIFAVIFAIAVATQIKAERFNKWLYWATIIATTTLGTTIADFVTRSLGIGYAGGLPYC